MDKFYLETDIQAIVDNISDVSESFSGKTILLSGGVGFLGYYFSNVFIYLNENVLEKPCKLIMVDNLITSDSRMLISDKDNDNYTFIQHNIIEPLQVDEKLDYVIHAAGIASPYYYRAYPLETLDVAIIGTRNMLELARKNNSRFVFFSSSEIYGDPDPKHIPISESYRGNVSCQGPRSCYDESKRVGETLCYIYHETCGLRTNTIRPFNIYGPGMKEKDYRVLPNFASRIKAGKPLKIYGTGNQTRTFCYITDAINGFLRVIIKGVPGEAYNIGTPDPEITMLELVEISKKIIGDKLNYDIIEHPDSYPADEPQRRCPDIRKAELQLGYTPKIDLETGLRNFYNWASEIYTGEQ